MVNDYKCPIKEKSIRWQREYSIQFVEIERLSFRDFAEFSYKWFAEDTCIEDLANNGVVDFADLGVFAKSWVWQEE